ncbi:transcription factor RcaD [Plectonema cf. radiosum LEGE 06105]|uniref:Transcription factor RcaD n=1 Tax=Plectonema cf. radiosum LEGE 06105 TaxID=945769 RepID=A0A8J7EZD7_9CYAN|nr:transcription factor RcaD [Plectonema radiosum]MBE9211485.1 transcription factor RcaD [Plectonema cf. radiosum LEGE 06105]
MDTNELKFLLKLLGCENYRTTLSGKVFTSFKGKNTICQNLGDRDIIDYSREIASVKILPPGQALLKLDAAEIPIEDKELKILENVGKASGKVAPSKIKSSLKAAEKEEILKSLSSRGLIETEIKIKKTKAEVWLTERGIEFLRDDYNPKKGANPTLSLDLLNNYLRFLRKTLQMKSEQPGITTESTVEITNITDEDILQIIQKLDKEIGTRNYLPIFYLREKLQPPLSRDELDKALYRLQADDKIELSTLQEANAFTPEQIDAGIVQNIGGPLFFISFE